MEILVTIIAFWLILVGAYGAYSLTQERTRSEKAPRVRPQPAVTMQTATAGAGIGGPFGPVSLPTERVPSFIARFTSSVMDDETAAEAPAAIMAREAAIAQEEESRFRAEAIVAARVARSRDIVHVAEFVPPARAVREEEPFLARIEASRPEAARHEAPRHEAPRHEVPERRQPSEVDVLRAQVEHLRSEIYALSSDQPRRVERPQQRRYRTGNYTHLPRTLRRQVNEVRGVRRVFSN